MKRFALTLVLAVVAAAALAGPTATVVPPYAAGSVQPTAASITANGGAPIACTVVKDAAGAATPTCDLSSLAVPGTYTLILSVSNVADCVVDTTGATTCYTGGVSASQPQSLVLVKSTANTTVVFKITP
jgi:hypothetical protein